MKTITFIISTTAAYHRFRNYVLKKSASWLPHASKVLFLALSVTFHFFCLCIKYLQYRWMDLGQIHRKDVFGPSLEPVWMSRSKVKSQGNHGQKTGFGAPITARQRQNSLVSCT